MTLWVLSVTFALIALVLFIYARTTFRKGQVLGSLGPMLFGSLLLTLGLFAATLGVGLRGYQALTLEHLAATLTIEAFEFQAFTATLTYPDGQTQRFNLAGDEIAIDAHILKWHPWANILGLHTAYQFDRIYGRYTSIEDEQNKTRTVYALSPNNPVKLLEWSKNARFQPFLDTEYGSSTFLPVQDKHSYEIRISTSGLLIRQLK